MSDKPDGRYQATIVAAYVAEDQWEKNAYVLKLDVNVEGGGAMTCRVKLADSGEEKDRRDAALRELDLPWPFKSADLAKLSGRGVDVNLKTSQKGRQNCYLATAMPEKILSPEEVDAIIGNQSELPF